MHLRTLTLSKHEGLGNDFLVLLDATGDTPVTGELARRLCDRHRGVGADGLMRVTRPTGEPGGAPVDAVMELYNADGSRAEMSGNGIRCLGQALLLGGWAEGPELAVATDAGLRRLTVVDGPAQGPAGGLTHRLSVDMGQIELGAEAPEWAVPRQTGSPAPPPFRARWANAGNPHLVLEVGDPGAVAGTDLVGVGEKVNADVPGGANIHLVAPGPGAGHLTVRTYERGVGLTEACGTGACASAVVAAGWGLLDRAVAGDPDGPDRAAPVTVVMPGGEAQVLLGSSPAGPGGRPVTLVGPATSVATVEYPWPRQP